jgi:hypothetical protein
VIDGGLQDVDPTCEAGEAQRELLRNVSETTGLSYGARWEQTKPDWWSAELTVEAGPYT